MLKICAKDESVKRFLKDVLSDEKYVLDTFKNSEDEKSIFFEIAEEEFSEFNEIVFKSYFAKAKSLDTDMAEKILIFINQLVDYDFYMLLKELEQM